jgi:PilZ domain
MVSGALMLNGSMIPRGVRRMFDERSEPREAAGSCSATLELRGRRFQVRVVNLSPSGAMVIFDALPRIGERVVLHLGDRGPVSGQVCWVKDGNVGVNFAAAGE